MERVISDRRPLIVSDAMRDTTFAADGSTAIANEITAYARAHLAGYKVPRSISYMEEIPRTGSGKILKRDLRKPFWEGRKSRV